MRVGIGYDVHAFGPGDHVTLGGVRIPHDARRASRIRTATCCCTRCAMRCSAPWRSATSASISPTATRAGRAPTAGASCGIARALLQRARLAARQRGPHDARARRRARRVTARRCGRTSRTTSACGSDCVNVKATTTRGTRRARTRRGSRLPGHRAAGARRRRAPERTRRPLSDPIAVPARRSPARTAGRPRLARSAREPEDFRRRRGARVRAGRRRAVTCCCSRREARREHRLGRGATRATCRRRSARRRATAVTRIATRVTRQAYTVPLAGASSISARLPGLAGRGLCACCAAHRHGRKLRPGSHRANRFELRIRDLRGDRGAIDARLAAIGERGRAELLRPATLRARGRQPATGDRPGPRGDTAPRDRSQRSFALSAARSHLFNAVLAARVARGDWNRLLPGEAVMLDGRRSFLHAPEPSTRRSKRAASRWTCIRAARCRAAASRPRRGMAREVEDGGARAARRHCVEAARVRERLDHERRSLRLPVREFDWQLRATTTPWSLRFVLPRGTFATAVLHEIAGGRV